MKKIKAKLLITMSFIIVFTCGTMAQTNDKCVSQGKFIIDAYYGYPYVVGKILKNISDESEERVINTNHIGGKFEYMVSDVIGLGADYTFARVTNYFELLDYENKNGQYKIVKGSFKETLTKQRILFRMSIHFGTTSKVDPYVSFGAGYKQSIYRNNFPSDYIINDVNINIIPISFRAGIGMRYFFSEHIGINAEAGIGGPVIQAGISAKL